MRAEVNAICIGVKQFTMGGRGAMSIPATKAVTWLGSGGVLWMLIGAAAVVLALRRRWRLAIYLLVAGVGAARIIDATSKTNAGLVRPQTQPLNLPVKPPVVWWRIIWVATSQCLG